MDKHVKLRADRLILVDNPSTRSFTFSSTRPSANRRATQPGWKSLTGNTVLLSTHHSNIAVTHSGTVLAKPRVVEVTIKNPNRRDVLDGIEGRTLLRTQVFGSVINEYRYIA
ncbi:hypothetical protein [Streptomyces sp. NBC_00120]|uniref:Uncharacterized protein n=1 Tax=Streptomyces sp. NBC_00119 TaxID=2975659 RepID=A0AAU1U190_9ACTN|nr:hypothetical protein [Streptomyces sp. NBC_00120]MCX5321842.1 hypothetical protein [Streptomyces sp. NBC_00120]MCX5326807.1 hypothetical protein [Streptomyces sp. NBC_00120]